MSVILVSEFRKLNSQLVDDCFVKETRVSDEWKFRSRLHNWKVVLSVKIRIFFSFLCLLALETEVVLYQLKMRKNGGLSGGYQFLRLYEIRKYIKYYKPKFAIEFGSGASSLLFAKHVKLVSVEESEEWLNKYRSDLDNCLFIRKSVKQKTLQSLLLCSRVESIDELGEKVSSYELTETVRNQPYDLAYIDGPTAWEQNRDLKGFINDSYGYLPNSSVLELKTLPEIILVDGRRATVSYLVRSEKCSNYKLILRGLLKNKTVASPYHTILTKNENARRKSRNN